MLRFWCLPLLLSFAFIGAAIVYSSGELLIKRRTRSSIFDDKPNVNSVLENRPNEFQLRKAPTAATIQPAQQQLVDTRSNSTRTHTRARDSSANTRLTETLYSIFRIGNDSGLQLFNTAQYDPFSPFPTTKNQHRMQAAESSIVRTTQKEPFKVQRSPDGKLNLVFNDSPSLQHNAMAQVTVVPKKPIREQIIFPDENQCDEADKVGKTFCEKVRNYPNQTYLDNILSTDYSKFKFLFGEDILEPQNISQRIGDDDMGEQEFCKSRLRVIFPESGLSINATWRLIVNSKEAKQGVRVELCDDENLPCVFSQHLPNGYESVCRQHYSYRQLVVIDQEKNGGETDLIKLPSCCKCVYRTKRP